MRDISRGNRGPTLLMERGTARGLTDRRTQKKNHPKINRGLLGIFGMAGSWTNVIPNTLRPEGTALNSQTFLLLWTQQTPPVQVPIKQGRAPHNVNPATAQRRLLVKGPGRARSTYARDHVTEAASLWDRDDVSRRALASRDFLLPPPTPYLPTARARCQGSGGDGEPRSPGCDESSGSAIGRGVLRDGLVWCTRTLRRVAPREQWKPTCRSGRSLASLSASKSSLWATPKWGKWVQPAGRGGTSARQSDEFIGWVGSHSTGRSPASFPPSSRPCARRGDAAPRGKFAWPLWPLRCPPPVPTSVFLGRCVDGLWPLSTPQRE
jgi:hypothetical protein